MSNGAGDIIIRAASAEVEFDPATFPEDPANPKKRKNAAKKITRIVITGDLTFDSGDRPSGWTCEVKASYK